MSAPILRIVLLLNDGAIIKKWAVVKNPAMGGLFLNLGAVLLLLTMGVPIRC